MLRVEGKTIIFTRGDTADFTITPKIALTGEPYTLQDGDAVIFRLKLKPRNGYDVALEKNCVIDLENNVARLHLDPEDTTKCQFKEYRYEFELVTAYGAHYTFIANETFDMSVELENHEEVATGE